MRAVVVDRFGHEPTVRNVPEPACPPDGAVVRVQATGVCRSDWHAWSGHDATMSAPYIPGHEFAGVLAGIGPQVRGWHLGDRVTAPFVQACGRCAQCMEGEQQVCTEQRQPGFGDDGSFAELVVVHRAEVNLVALPEAMPAVTAAGLGCRTATAYGAVARPAGTLDGRWVAVHGCGGVGLAAVLFATALGARVVAVDVSPAALAAARAAGAREVVDAGATDAAAAVREATGGGAHVSLDAYGSAATCRASVLGLRPRGRHVQVGLLLGDEAQTALPMDRVVGAELTVAGSHGLAAHRYRDLFALVARAGLSLDRLVARTVPLGEAPGALVALGAATGPGGTTVVVLD